jgi:S-(hydroxymethyl)glutathione dehydrogenase / alcohol dehydrogenase
MKAAVFHKPGDIRCENVPDPKLLHDRDAIIKVTSTAICGSDLHIYNGYFPQPRNMVLGHEFMGIVEEVGMGVDNLKKGDRVVVPFPIACGNCFFCSHHVPTGCENSNPKNFGPKGGILTDKAAGMFGYTDLYGGYDGGQAQYVRVPFADYGPRKIPDELTDEQALFLTDILPTGWAGVDWANVKGGETVVVFGCGPVGLMAQKAAWLKGAKRVIGVDVLPYRLEMAKKAANSETLNSKEIEIADAIIEMTDGHGADVCIDAVGMEADRNLFEKASDILHMQSGSIKVIRDCVSSVRRGGVISVLGVYGTSYDNFPLGQWMDKGVQIKTGQAPVHNYIDHLLDLLVSKQMRTDDIITHTMTLDEVSTGYKIFNNKDDNCVKVIMKPN